MRCADALACDIWLMIMPSMPSGKKTNTRYRLNFCHSPKRQRAVDDLPPAEVVDRRLAQVGDQEHHREQEREDARDVDLLRASGRRRNARNACCCSGSRTKALTTLMPARFS